MERIREIIFPLVVIFIIIIIFNNITLFIFTPFNIYTFSHLKRPFLTSFLI